MAHRIYFHGQRPEVLSNLGLEVAMNKILVTGAGGFVGRSLIPELKNKGYSVVGTVRKGSCEADRCLIKSLGPETFWEDALEGVSTVIHLAAHVHRLDENPLDTLTTYRTINTDGTIHLAKQAIKSGVRRFIFISTIKVLGQERSAPYTDIDPPDPMDAYAISKWEAEKRLAEISKKSEMDYVILRPTLVYGPGVKANFFNLLRFVEKGIPLPFLNIKNNRSLLFSGNLISAIITCIEHPRAADQTFLISDEPHLSTSNLIRMIAESMGRPYRLFPFPGAILRLAAKITDKEQIYRRLCGSLYINSDRINERLGWQRPYSAAQGIYMTTNWFLNRPSTRE
jgi:nucleoside-diphosphate-sugar epimerase